MSINSEFKARVLARQAVLVPGAFNALSARVVEDLGFEAVYVTGAGVTNMALGLPDLGFISITDLVQTTSAIRDSTSLPIIVDADTGFGNALNVRYTIRSLERAGASVVQLEDQVMPKKCGHFSGKAVIETGEMVSKISAAVDARQDSNLQILARTDSRAVLGFEAAVQRANRFLEAGADIIFVEAPESTAEIKKLTKAIDAPQLVNLVVGGRTPILDQGELREAGFSLVLYANAALQGAVLGMQHALRQLRENGRLDESAPVVSFNERQRLVQKPLHDELETRYSGNLSVTSRG